MCASAPRSPSRDRAETRHRAWAFAAACTTVSAQMQHCSPPQRRSPMRAGTRYDSRSFSCQARQHDIADNPDRRNPLLLVGVVPGRDGDHDVKFGEYEQALAAIAERAYPMRDRAVRRIPVLEIAAVPEIAIATLFVDGDVRLERPVEPFRRNDLAAVPLSVIENELPDAGKIARRHAQAG